MSMETLTIGKALNLGLRRAMEDDVEHLQRRCVQLVQRTVHRHRHRQPAGQRDDVRGGGPGDVGPGRQQRGQLLVAAGAQPGGERGGGVGGHPLHATTPPVQG